MSMCVGNTRPNRRDSNQSHRDLEDQSDIIETAVAQFPNSVAYIPSSHGRASRPEAPEVVLDEDRI